MKKINLIFERKRILNNSKKCIIKNGWNKNLFKLISQHNKINIQKLFVLFPENYYSLLQLYLDELNLQMTKKVKKLNLLQYNTHEKIKKIVMLRISINKSEKQLIKKTYYTLLLPTNVSFSISSLYKTVDQIWFLSGDVSTDFNFYTKRIILAKIYILTVLYSIKCDDEEKVALFLDKQLQRVSMMPRIKSYLKQKSKIFSKI